MIMIQFQLSEAERTVLVKRVNEGTQHLCFIWAENIKANMGKKHKNDKCMVQRIKKQQLCEKGLHQMTQITSIILMFSSKL